jgi:hypothetical protein
MRILWMVLSLAVGVPGSWRTLSAAQTKQLYTGPRSISFGVIGLLSATKGGSIDLTNGAVIITGPLARMRSCGPSDQRHFSFAAQDLAKFRSLAVKAKPRGCSTRLALSGKRRKGT